MDFVATPVWRALDLVLDAVSGLLLDTVAAAVSQVVAARSLEVAGSVEASCIAQLAAGRILAVQVQVQVLYTAVILVLKLVRWADSMA